MPTGLNVVLKLLLYEEIIMDEMNKLPEDLNGEKVEEQITPAPKTIVPKLPLIIGGVVAGVAAIIITVALILGGGNNNQGGGNTPDENEHEHSYGEWTVVDESTCTVAGVEERSCECGEKETRPAAALGHTYDDKYDAICNECGYERTIDCKHDNPEKIEIVPFQSPTCQETGLTEGMKCTLCGTMVVPQAIVPVIDCIASDWIVDYDATHIEDGMRHAECTMCGRIVKEDVILSGQNKMKYKLLSDNTYKVYGIGQCSDKDIVIPNEYNGLPVTSIGDRAFYDCDRLSSVVIGDSVTSIGQYAFSDCDSLSSVVIDDGVTSIGYRAFDSCTSLSSVVIPDSVTSIGDWAFDSCTSLSSIVIGDSVTSIGEGAFYDCDSLSSVVIGDSVTSIGNHAFAYCDSLSSVVIGDSVTSISERAFSDCTSLTSVVIGDSVTSIGDYAFYKCNSLKDVYYTGSEEEWQAISIDNHYGSNYYLVNATIHYNYVPEN